MAIEMVDLMQEAAGDNIVAFIFVPIAVPILRANDNVLRTGPSQNLTRSLQF